MIAVEQILLKSLSDYRKNLKFILPHAFEYALDIAAFFLIAVIILIAIGLSLPSLAVEDLESLYTQIPFFGIAAVIFGFLLFLFIIIFLNSAARAAIIGMAGDCFQEKRATLSGGLESAKKYGAGVFVYQILLGAAYLVLVLIAVLTIRFLATGSLLAVALAVFALLFCFLLFLPLYVFTIFVPQEIVLKEKGLIESFKGSFLFVRENFKAVIAYGAVASVVIISVGVLSIGIGLLGSEGIGKILAKVLQNLFALIAGLIIAPYFEIVKTYMVESRR